MPVYDGNSKAKDLYYGGTKIKEAYYGGVKVYSGIKPLYYCYRYTPYGNYYYFQTPMTYVGQAQRYKAKNKNDYSQVSSSSQLTYTSSPIVVKTITSNGFINDDPIVSFEFSRYEQGDLYT